MAGRTPTNEELIEAYLDWQRREKGRTAMTVHKYRYTLVAFVESMGGKNLLHASLEDMRAFVLAPVARATRRSAVGDEPMAATKKRRVSELRSFYKWLQAEGFRYDNPALRLVSPPVHNENPRPVPEETWIRFWTTLRHTAPEPELVAFGLGYFGGLRRSEVMALSSRMFEQGKLIGFPRKGGRKGNLPLQSCVQLLAEKRPELIPGGPDSFWSPLAELVRERRNCERLIPWGTDTTTERGALVNKRLRRALRRSGMDDMAFSPHQLRHSFCTNMLEAGVPILSVARLANHSSVTITQRYLLTAEDPIAELLGHGECNGTNGLL